VNVKKQKKNFELKFNVYKPKSVNKLATARSNDVKGVQRKLSTMGVDAISPRSFQSIKIYYIVLSAKMVEKSGREVRCVKFPRVPPNYCLTTIMLYSMLFDCKIGLDEQSKTSVSISNSMFAER
jgi:hypothetical protein